MPRCTVRAENVPASPRYGGARPPPSIRLLGAALPARLPRLSSARSRCLLMNKRAALLLRSWLRGGPAHRRGRGRGGGVGKWGPGRAWSRLKKMLHWTRVQLSIQEPKRFIIMFCFYSCCEAAFRL
ncbi:hypothetical protein NDU88_010863 [Pleurodeles waltl]|uniref:Uncharacterized protein n=1 Tax=Pleurodeles waltl TaxID=8319 RepID=A0AAV7S0U4_PLEWA|nr:hypothetical protein NDU88_010863 [Pleurodeles waltl]